MDFFLSFHFISFLFCCCDQESQTWLWVWIHFVVGSHTLCCGALIHLVRSSHTSSCRISHTWLGFSLTLDCGYLTYLVMVLSHIWLWVLTWLLALTYLAEVLDKLEVSHTLGCSAHTYWLWVFTYLTVVVPHINCSIVEITQVCVFVCV